jgi:uncharacterized protein YndB with AHSA1/START domain
MEHGTLEQGTIEREIQIDATPEVVFEVITSPEHIRAWWNGAVTDVAATPGTVARIAWAEDSDDPHIETMTVVAAEPPRLFSFRWVADGAIAEAGNSLLVTFELAPNGDGTLLRMTETGFREKGWEAAVLEAAYADHVNGWDIFVPSIRDYVARMVRSS